MLLTSVECVICSSHRCFHYRRWRWCRWEAPYCSEDVRLTMGKSHEGWWKSDSHSESWDAWSHSAKGFAQVEKLQQVLASRPDSIHAFRPTGSLVTLSLCSARCAMPFGGFEKANQFLKFQLPEAESTKEEPEPPVVYQQDIGCRPSFNRTPIGWVGSSEPSSIHMETDAVPFDGETDELWKIFILWLRSMCNRHIHASMNACIHTN